MSTVRFGVIGCGMIGKLHADIITENPNAVLAAVSRSEELSEKYGCSSYEDYRELLRRDDIDAVAVCTPSGMHHQIVLDAAQAGKHVMVEKPIEIEVERAEAMIEACQKHNVWLSVVMQHRFDDPIQAMKRAINAGSLGDLCFASSRTIWYREPRYYGSNSWRGTIQYDGGGALLNQSIHYVDLLLYFMGAVESVNGKCRTLFHKGIEVEDTGIATLQFKNGAIGTLEGTTLAYPGLFTELNIYGEKGTFVFKNDQLEFYKLKTAENQELEQLVAQTNDANTGHSKAEALDNSSHKKQYADMISAIKNNHKPFISGEDAIEALKVIKAIYQSSKSGREVFL